TAFATAMSAYLAYALVLFAWSSFATGRTSSTIDATPLVYPQGMIAFGAILLALQFLARLIRLVLREPPEDETGKEAYGVE
ncbi:MAG: TRAP transporter small permease, partial [Alphaproteobacteria bacterium]